MLALANPPGAEITDRTVVAAASIQLDSGEVLTHPRLEVRLHGDPGAPKVLVLGGISATRRLNGADGWWDEVVGPRAGIDTNRFCALGVDFLPCAATRLAITPNDQARLMLAALDGVGVTRLHAMVGASYGGMVGLALAALAPQRVERLCVISAAHEPSPLGSAWRGVQRRIVEAGLANGDVAGALSLARQLAMITYRSADEFAARFERKLGACGRSDLDRYLAARGEAFADAMAPQRWLSLSESIDRAAIDPSAIATPTMLIACSSDQLTPLSQMEELARQLPRLAGFHVLTSRYGHDAFLKEPAQISRALRRALEESPR